MHSPSQRRLLLGSLSLLYAFGLLAACGAIPSWGRWYSLYPYHRLQAEALLHGRLALSRNPADLCHDLCWSEGGVQQVWGLGIPLWLLPFEALAKLLGASPFPEMIALALFMAAAAYVVLQTWLGRLFDRDSRAAERSDPDLTRGAVAAGAILLFLFFAPLINLLRCRMYIYEEVMVYVYFFGLILCCGVLALARRPRWRRFWLLCALAGLGGLIRPTLVFYGSATIVAAGCIMARFEEGQLGLLAKRLILGLLAFMTGGGFLFVTNYLRFGSGWEFGHSLNLSPRFLLPNIYSLHFDYPFSRIPLGESARELFGALFQADNFAGRLYASGIFPGQSATTRLRQFDFRTFDISYAAGVGSAWLIGIWTAWKSLYPRVSPAGERGGFRPPPSYALLIFWSALASAPLIVLYLKSPSITSRYMLDFAPAFAAALLGVHWFLMESGALSKRRLALCSLALVFGWQGLEIAMAESSRGTPLHLTRESLTEIKAVQPSSFDPPPDDYKIGDSLKKWGIQFNGVGWNEKTGRAASCATFFVESPEFLELELTAAPGAHATEASLAVIRAKVGLEYLERTSVMRVHDAWIVRYAPPKRPSYRTGLQTVSLAFVPSQDLGKYIGRSSPWILRRMSWRTRSAQRPAPSSTGTAVAPAPASGAALHWDNAIPAEAADAHLNTGIELEDAGHLDKAVIQYRQALILAPRGAGAHYDLAIVLNKQGRHDEASVHYREAIRLDPAMLAAYLNLGLLLERSARPEEAADQYKAALKIDPRFADAYVSLGVLRRSQGRLDEAVENYRRALAIRPDYVAAVNDLGLVFESQGKLSDAERCYRQALKLEPGHFGAHLNLGNVYFHLGRFQDAARQYRAALKIDPGNPGARRNLSLVAPLVDRGP